jgi:hypothetical protein
VSFLEPPVAGGRLLGSDSKCFSGLLDRGGLPVRDEALVDVLPDAVVELGQRSASSPTVTPAGSEPIFPSARRTPGTNASRENVSCRIVRS